MRIFTESPDQLLKAGLIRRLAAMVYDSLLCIALLMTTTGLYMLASNAVVGSERYKAMTESGQTLNDPLLSSLLFIVLFLFFGFFWTKNGQTLGMQAWRLRVQNEDGSSLTWNQALLRFLMAGVSTAGFGLGYFWMLIDKKDRTWQCLFSKSIIVRIPKKK